MFTVSAELTAIGTSLSAIGADVYVVAAFVTVAAYLTEAVGTVIAAFFADHFTV